MLRKRSILGTVVVTLTVLAGCASPEVADVQEVGDSRLTCAQIEQEVREAERLEEAARRERGVTGTNVAAAVFFWPGLLGTYANTEEAINAARDRKEALHDLYRDKGCE